MDRTSSEHDERVYEFTKHARRRMDGRRINEGAVEAVLEYGRIEHISGGLRYIIGKREVARYLALGLDLAKLEGIQVICAHDGLVLTVYRNHKIRKTGARRRFHRNLAQVSDPVSNVIEFLNPRRTPNADFPRGA